ncbi:protein-L-isoaspartate O-methyltransferase family protein [Halocatena marina]|uniref:protein-L-isoaspartate(D-aspartate) O-methyltransferase n=1 Tax=Halocatena marina TaxID=2934937 RepID=A0ABD5YNQ1_9EURY|nr:protein-L-isoaspartate O-methyltransferase [Halocatena marina]
MDRAVLRDDMVDSLEHEAKGWINTESVSLAMRSVPRHEFVPDEQRAYADCSFEQFGTRVLAPSTAARLVEALDPTPDDSVLIVGVGVGYTAAVVAEIVGDQNVQAIDITRRLVWEARNNLARAGYNGVLVDRHDGSDGLPAYAPYDRILLEAAAIEPPQTLLRQLGASGHLVMPLGASTQRLVSVSKDGTTVDEFGRVAFSPMLVDGEQVDTVERNRTVREDREFAARESEGRHGWEQHWIDWTHGQKH